MKIEDISLLDSNFAGEDIRYEGLEVYDIKSKPFHVYGFYNLEEEEKYYRLPGSLADRLNKQVRSLYRHTSGGRIRFRTNSTKIILNCILPSIVKHSHMPRTGSGCFDLYVDGEYFNVFRPERNIQGFTKGSERTDEGYESGYVLGEPKIRDILINFPLYNRVDDVFIALDEDAVVEEACEYTYNKPIVFYGSSITQGACASHPGNCYPLMLSRRLDADILNLGFSDGARGEIEMAEYIASLDMSALVYDYDHNAKTIEELEYTHERMFQIIRNKNKDIPIIMVSCADRHFKEEVDRRKDIIKTTYEHAVRAGDKNVYFVDGQSIYDGVGREYCTVDDIHPNDIGFLMMANAIENVLKRAMEDKAIKA